MPLRALSGFEARTTAGWTTGTLGFRMFDVATSTPTIDTTTPRNGAACLEIAATGAAKALGWTTSTLGTGQNRGRAVFAIRAVNALPVAASILASFTAGSNCEFRHNPATGRLAVAFEGGTLVDGPIWAPNTWYLIELYFDCSTGGAKFIDWWVDGSPQNRCDDAGAADTIGGFELGCSFAGFSYTTRYDDVLVWTDTVAIAGPVGDHKVVHLIPDTAGALDVSTILVAEWNTFAGATPTLTAWNATTALNAIDERPVGLGAAADGFCRITGTDTDFVGVPFTSYTLQAGESITGLRMEACCWAASTTTATLSFATHNGTTARTIFAAANPTTSNSATAPGWVCAMATQADFDTQAKVNALQIRVGCTDSTPDIGVHALYVSMAVKLAGGTNYSQTPSDSTGLTDTSNTSSGKLTTATDNAGLTDTPTLDLVIGRTDTVGLTDTATVSPVRSLAITDNAGLTDLATASLAREQSATDTAGLTDTAVVANNLGRSDTTGLTDTSALTASLVLSDQAGLTDTAAAAVVKAAGATDAVGLTDVVIIAQDVRQEHADSTGLTDAVALTRLTVANDALGLTDASTRELAKAITANDSTGLVDTTALAATLSAQDVTGLTDSAVTVAAYLRTQADTIGLTDSAAAQRLLISLATDAIALTDTATIDSSVGPSYTPVMVGVEGGTRIGHLTVGTTSVQGDLGGSVEIVGSMG